MRTPVENLERWIAALRSGNYKQGRGRLRTDEDHYCCLGVACDVFAPTWYDHEDDHLYYYYCGVSSTMPTEVARAHGLDCEGIDSDTLVNMNDGKGASFAEIADFIEQTILPRVRSEQEKVQS